MGADVAMSAVPRSLLGKASAVRRPRLPHPHPNLGRLAARVGVAARDHVATVTAMAAIDLGAFQASSVAGWIVTGLSVLVLDWKIQG